MQYIRSSSVSAHETGQRLLYTATEDDVVVKRLQDRLLLPAAIEQVSGSEMRSGSYSRLGGERL